MAQPPLIRHRTLLDRAKALPRWLWRELAELAEMLSDVGHGPRRWREGSRVYDPYAGAGPDAPPGALTDETTSESRTSEE